MKQDLNVYKELMKEVLTVCQDNQISCILSDQSAQQLLDCEEHGKPLMYPFYLIVKADDIDKLEKLLAHNMGEDRLVESMKTSNAYPDFSLHYVNNKVTCIFNRDTGLLPNAGIFILPLRKKINGKKSSIFFRLERWQLRCGNTLYPLFRKIYVLGHEKEGIIYSNNTRKCTYLVKELTKPFMMKIGETVYPVSGQDLSRKTYDFGRNLGDPYVYLPKFQKDSEKKLASVPCKNIYMSFVSNLFGRTSKKLAKKLWPVNSDWQKVQCVNARDILSDVYMPKKPLLKVIYKRGNKERMRKELFYYHRYLRRYYKSAKLTIVFDRDIYNYYCWSYGEVNPDWIKKTKKRIPSAWR